jgi:leucyl-tRNA synthetase
MPVDLYNGGMEHTTLHLLYSRFIYKFLYDIKVVPNSEPYAKRRSHGMVLAGDGQKMSKSFGNVINPDQVIKGYGADSLRLYEMFMGPFEEAINWNTKGLEGCYRFLKKVWAVYHDSEKIGSKSSKEVVQKLHYIIKKVGDDIENFKFNTAVAAMMEFVNLWIGKDNVLAKKDAENFLKILAPFCPHITEELWSRPRSGSSIFKEKWPEYDKKLVKKETFELVIQVNGKVRDKVEAPIDISQKEAEKVALEREKIKKWVGDKKPKVVIFVKTRLINIVI